MLMRETKLRVNSISELVTKGSKLGKMWENHYITLKTKQNKQLLLILFKF